MPKYQLPARTERNDDAGQPVASIGGSSLDWQRKITVPANKEIIDALEVGESATVQITGTIISLSSSERDKEKTATLEIDADAVAAYPQSTKDLKDMNPTEYRRHREAMGDED